MPAHIGTSGWSYNHWKDVFYPRGLKPRQWLEYYAARFSTVEVNNSFYHLPKDSTYDAWRDRTPANFAFAVKASRYITHVHRLRDASEPLGRFFSGALRLGAKLAVVLFQLPPSFNRDEALLARFLDEARKTAGEGVRFALEVRNDSWLEESVYEVLFARNAALVFADWGEISPVGPVTADFAYLRRHGPAKEGTQGYNGAEMAAHAQAVKTWLADGLDVFAYYNNDYGGHAVANAAQLEGLLSGRNPAAGTGQGFLPFSAEDV